MFNGVYPLACSTYRSRAAAGIFDISRSLSIAVLPTNLTPSPSAIIVSTLHTQCCTDCHSPLSPGPCITMDRVHW